MFGLLLIHLFVLYLSLFLFLPLSLSYTHTHSLSLSLSLSYISCEAEDYCWPKAILNLIKRAYWHKIIHKREKKPTEMLLFFFKKQSNLTRRHFHRKKLSLFDSVRIKKWFGCARSWMEEPRTPRLLPESTEPRTQRMPARVMRDKRPKQKSVAWSDVGSYR